MQQNGYFIVYLGLCVFCFVVSYLIYSYLFVNRFLRLKKIEMKNLVIQSIIHTFV